MVEREMTPCAECGMPCRAGEYHPYSACLMFKSCHNGDTVRASLQDVLDHAARRTTPDREAIIDSILAKLDPMIRPGILDEPYHSERNGLIMAWNVVASFKTSPASDKGGA